MSPEDVHKLAAAIVLAIVAPMLAIEAHLLHGRWTRFVIPIGVFLIGAFLLLDPVLFHGGSFGAEGVQHQLQGAMALVVALIEFERARGKLQARGWGLALPLGFVALGMVFIVHSQHGAMVMRAQLALHRILGATLIMMAAIKAADVMGWVRGNVARVGGLWLGVNLALQLVLHAADTTRMLHGGH